MKPVLIALLAFFLPVAWGLAAAPQAARTLELNEKNYLPAFTTFSLHPLRGSTLNWLYCERKHGLQCAS
jgi:hypothetical protein